MNVLGIVPHADDETVFAGSITKFIKEGGSGTIICLTGNKQRKKEFMNSCNILGVKGIFLGLKDRGLRDINWKKEVDKLIKLIREIKPHLIFTISKFDYHPDHKKTIELIKEAVEFASHGVKGKAWLVKKVLMFEVSNLFTNPDYLINIDDEINKKINSLKVYVSQLTAKHKEGYYTGVFLKKAELRGLMAGCKYAEACIELKFPIYGNFYCEDRTLKSFKEIIK